VLHRPTAERVVQAGLPFPVGRLQAVLRSGPCPLPLVAYRIISLRIQAL